MTSTPVAPAVALNKAIVRVRGAGGRVVGAGFLVGVREVLTCAHVVLEALEAAASDGQPLPAGVEVVVDFPLVAPGRTCSAEVVAWHPPQPDNTGDVAGLRLTGDPPQGARATRLVTSTDLWAHPFRTFGFPKGLDGGVWASGRLLGRQATNWVQLEDVKQTGHRVQPGFSGAPVWDDELHGVVGMAVAAEGRPEVRGGYLTPTDVLVTAWPALAEQAVPPCPYRGLLAFGEQDAERFFGREELTGQLVEQLTRRSLVAVVGPSGSGKSSLVFAGAVPRIRQRQGWEVAQLRPAVEASPFDGLAAALLPSLEPRMTEAERLVELPKLATVLAEGRLAAVVDRALERVKADRLLLVVDQFEELYAQTPAAARRFVDVLVQAVAAKRQRPSPALVVVLTLRADFLGVALEHAGLAEVLGQSMLAIGQMTRDQLREAIERPASQEGVTYEAHLIDRILDDVGVEPGNLPLLEFALTLLWERQERQTLTHAAYESLGGVAGALAGHAEQTYLDTFPETEWDAARRVFVQLVQPGEATAPTRRVARRTELDEARWQLAQRLAPTRLVVTGRDAAGGETVEVVHEALISKWERLRRWVDADRIFRTWQERLRGALHQWQDSRQDTGALLRGAPLVEAERWLAERPEELSGPEREYIKASRAFQDRTVRRLRALAGSLAVLVLIAATFGVLAVQRGRAAAEQQRIAIARLLIAQAEAARATDPRAALALGITAQQVHPDAETYTSLVSTLTTTRYAGSLAGDADEIWAVAFSRAGDRLATGGRDGTVRLWDMTDPGGPRPVDPPLNARAGGVYSVAFTSDDGTLATGHANGTVRLWDLRSATPIATLHPAATPQRPEVWSVAFAPDGRTLAAASGAGTLTLWNVATPGEPRQLGPTLTTGAALPAERARYPHPFALAFAPDGRTLASGSFGPTAQLWDVSDPAHPGRLGRPLAGHQDEVWSVAFGKGGEGGRGRLFATGSRDGSVLLWDLADRRRPRRLGALRRHRGEVWAVAFAADGTMLATAGQDTTVILWDLSDPRRPVPAGMPLTGHRDAVQALAFAPTGSTLATGSLDKTVRLWTLAGPGGITRLGRAPRAAHDPILTIASTARGDLLAAGGADGRVNLWQIASRTRPVPLARPWYAHEGAVQSVAFAPDGRTLASAGMDRVVLLWDVTDPAGPRQIGPPLRGHIDNVRTVAFAPDGRILASGSGDADSVVLLWDVTDPARPRRIGPPLRGESNGVQSLAFSPDGATVAAGGGDKALHLWDVTDPAHPTHLGAMIDHSEGVRGVAFAPGGDTVATASGDQTIRLWDFGGPSRAARPLPALTGHEAEVWSVAFAVDGRLLATGADDRTVRLWDATDRERPVSLGEPLTGHTGIVRAVAFADANTLATAGGDGTVLLWDLTGLNRLRRDALQRACVVTDGGLGSAEWARLAPGLPYGNGCSNRPP